LGSQPIVAISFVHIQRQHLADVSCLHLLYDRLLKMQTYTAKPWHQSESKNSISQANHSLQVIISLFFLLFSDKRGGLQVQGTRT